MNQDFLIARQKIPVSWKPGWISQIRNLNSWWSEEI